MTNTATVSATKQIECWFEYAGSVKETLASGLRRIDDPDDPRWDGEIMEKPFGGDPHGYLQVAEVTRVDGEIAKSRGICGYAYHPNRAREFMRLFRERVEKNLDKPWDVDHTNRDLLEQAKLAREEGRDQDLEKLVAALAAAVGKQALPEPPKERASRKAASAPQGGEA